MQNENSVQRVTVKPRQAREMLSIGKTKYFALVKNGIIETVMVGGTRMPTIRGIERLLSVVATEPTKRGGHGRPPKVEPTDSALSGSSATATGALTLPIGNTTLAAAVTPSEPTFATN